MEIEDIYEELDNFYKIRGDNLARKYILEFLRVVEYEGVELSDYQAWYDCNVHKLGKRFKVNTRYTYRSILKQFIRYLLVVDGVLERKSFMGSDTVVEDEVPVGIDDTVDNVVEIVKERTVEVPKHTGTRIYDNFYEFNKNS